MASSQQSLLSASVRTCATVWLALYLGVAFLIGLPAVAFHAVAIGLLVCAMTFFRLPAADPADVAKILGPPDSSNAFLGTVAHRAAGMDAPENTLAALRLAKKKGARCVEFDVSFTRDKVAVVFHDDSLERTTGETGLIADRSLAEVKALDAAATHLFRDAFSPERVPSLDEFVDECLRLDLRMMIDLKTWRSPAETADVVCRLFASRPQLYSSALVTTFFPHLVFAIRSRDPRIVAAMAWRPLFLSYEGWYGESLMQPKSKRRNSSLLQHWAAVVGDVVLQWAYHELFWHFLSLSAVLVQKEVITKEYAETWRLKGLRVIAWTVNNSLQKAYLNDYLGVVTLSDTMDRVPTSELIEGGQGKSADKGDTA